MIDPRQSRPPARQRLRGKKKSYTENGRARWSRLKRESAAAAPAGSSPTPAAFDPASLPSIESIVADSDIRQFLHADVPPELTRAALRSAWSADPAIRDFVGIAESQWDFNDEASMPGFGPILAADYLTAQMLLNPDPVQDSVPVPPGAENPEPTVQRTQLIPELRLADTADEIQQTAAKPAPDPDEPELAGSDRLSRPTHSHGSALPK